MRDDHPRSQWRKSSRIGNNGACVEVAFLGANGVAARDSKDPGGPELVFPGQQWAAFLDRLRDGR